MPYRHVQRGPLVSMALLVPGLIATAVLLSEGFGAFSFLGLLFLVPAWLFSSLTVQVDGQHVQAAFGPGLVRRRIPLTSILEAEPVRNRWYHGWGIRWVPGGWMFNLQGLDAVRLTLPHGRQFRIGTNDPHGLTTAIREAAGHTGHVRSPQA